MPIKFLISLFKNTNSMNTNYPKTQMWNYIVFNIWPLSRHSKNLSLNCPKETDFKLTKMKLVDRYKTL